MTIIRFLILFIGLNLLVGCRRHDAASNMNSYDILISQCDTIVSLDELNVFDPVIVSVNDSVAILSTEYVLFSYDLSENNLSELIKVGDGPYDVVDFTSIGLSDSNRIWVYDGNVGKYITLESNGSNKNAILAPKLRMLNELQPVSSNRLIGVPYGGTVGYHLYDSIGNIIDSLSYFPPKPENVTDWTHSIACSGHIAISNDGKYFARSVAKDGGIDFFEYKNDKIANTARYAQFDMDYEAEADEKYPVPITSDKSRCGYYSLSDMNEGFVALFSPMKIFDNPDFASTEIHTFSNDGSIEKIYKLSFPLTSIAFDSATDNIVGVTASSDDTETKFLIRINI